MLLFLDSLLSIEVRFSSPKRTIIGYFKAFFPGRLDCGFLSSSVFLPCRRSTVGSFRLRPTVTLLTLTHLERRHRDMMFIVRIDQ
jgi:hypothetical protein